MTKTSIQPNTDNFTNTQRFLSSYDILGMLSAIIQIEDPSQY